MYLVFPIAVLFMCFALAKHCAEEKIRRAALASYRDQGGVPWESERVHGDPVLYVNKLEDGSWDYYWWKTSQSYEKRLEVNERARERVNQRFPGILCSVSSTES